MGLRGNAKPEFKRRLRFCSQAHNFSLVVFFLFSGAYPQSTLDEPLMHAIGFSPQPFRPYSGVRQNSSDLPLFPCSVARGPFTTITPLGPRGLHTRTLRQPAVFPS